MWLWECHLLSFPSFSSSFLDGSRIDDSPATQFAEVSAALLLLLSTPCWDVLGYVEVFLLLAATPSCTMHSIPTSSLCCGMEQEL